MKFLMLESFFFVTLGISCILLLMLIYHFKTRLSQLENNQQTLFEVINNIVQELTEIKHIVVNNQSSMPASIGGEKINVNIDNDDIPELIVNEDVYKSDNVSDSEYDSDEESDSDDNEDSDEDSDDNEEEDSNSDEVKMVSVDIDDSLDEIEHKEDTSLVDDHDDNLEQVEINTEEIENIKVNKLEETSVLEESDNVSLSSSVSKSVYKKMNVASLKALVIEKGLSTDPGKMKKNELIDLLDSNA